MSAMFLSGHSNVWMVMVKKRKIKEEEDYRKEIIAIKIQTTQAARGRTRKRSEMAREAFLTTSTNCPTRSVFPMILVVFSQIFAIHSGYVSGQINVVSGMPSVT